MATSSSLSQFSAVKNSSERLLVAVEDVNQLWPALKEQFEARSPYKRALLNNKARNQVFVEKLPVEYILTTDARLRARLPTEQLNLPFWFRHPYATIVLVTCEDLDEYKNLLKPRLKTIVQNEDREWFIVFVLKSVADSTNKLIKRVYSKLEGDFSSKRRERCCKLDMHGADVAAWEDLESKIVECIRNTLDRRVQYYEEEVRKLSDNRFLPTWSFCNFLIVKLLEKVATQKVEAVMIGGTTSSILSSKESLAFMFEMASLQEDALREYDELEQIYLEIGNITDFAKTQLDAPNVKGKEFGGTDPGDNYASLLDGTRKPFTQFVHDGVVQEFDFRQYLFSRQAQLLFSLNRPAEVAARGHTFIMNFSKTLTQHEKYLPFCLREVWVVTACLTLVKATAQRFTWRTVRPDMEKDFYRLQADLYFYARTKLMRLADLIGYGKSIERSPCNSAALSMLPWPRPAKWPSVPPDASSLILAKEQATQQEKLQGAPVLKKQLSLSPNVLTRAVNRRRGSLSAGNLSELMNMNIACDAKASPAADGTPDLEPASSQGEEMVDSSISSLKVDRPMNLPEIQAAAEHALLSSITDEQLRKSLSSPEDFEEFYLDLTRATADNFHRSWRKRHGVILDGEVAAVFYRRGALDAAAKLYEKVCALYASERWNALLAEVLPRLMNCQRQLHDWSGYLVSCIKLLSLDSVLVPTEDRHSLEDEIVNLAHNVLKVPMSLDVSALITFAARGGAPLELCDSDPGILEVVVWSGFVDGVSLESLSLTLMATFSADEGAQVVKSVQSPVLLKPGKNMVSLSIPPQRPGSYVLGVFTGHMGHVRMQSHTYCSTSATSFKGGSPESDDFLSSDKPLRPVLEVLQPRPLLEITAVVARGLLMKERQWAGIVLNPLDYSLKGATLHISTRLGLQFDPNQSAQLELYKEYNTHTDDDKHSVELLESSSHTIIQMKNGKLELPDWASTMSSVVWICVVASPEPDEFSTSSGIQPFGVPPPSPKPIPTRRTSSLGPTRTTPVVPLPVALESPSTDGLENGNPVPEQVGVAGIPSTRVGQRTLNVKMEFGASRSRLYERALSFHFTSPFHAVTRIVSRGKDGSLLLQVILKSQVEATLVIMSASLSLQPGFAHIDNNEGRPSPAWLLPLTFSATTEGALLFVIRSDLEGDGESGSSLAQFEKKSVLHVQYKIVGDRRYGAHFLSWNGSEAENQKLLDFSTSFILKMPVLEQLVSVGMLPVPSQPPRVGHQIVFRWRIERLKAGRALPVESKQVGSNSKNNSPSTDQDPEELLYELRIGEESWMIAGRKKGRIYLPQQPGAQLVISMACVPLVAGHVHPPALRLANISKAHISHNPAGPHLICVLPPAPCSSFCVKKVIN